MAIDPIFPQPAVLPQSSNIKNNNQNPGESFGQALSNSLQALNKSQQQADEAVKNYMTGDLDNLHQVVVAMDEAKFDMQLAKQVRDKLLEAYQEMMRMRV